PVGSDLAVDLHVQRLDLRDAQVAQGLGGAIDGGAGGLLPRLGAGADDLDDLVDALGHGASGVGVSCAHSRPGPPAAEWSRCNAAARTSTNRYRLSAFNPIPRGKIMELTGHTILITG